MTLPWENKMENMSDEEKLQFMRDRVRIVCFDSNHVYRHRITSHKWLGRRYVREMGTQLRRSSTYHCRWCKMRFDACYGRLGCRNDWWVDTNVSSYFYVRYRSSDCHDYECRRATLLFASRCIVWNVHVISYRSQSIVRRYICCYSSSYYLLFIIIMNTIFTVLIRHHHHHI